MRKARLTIPPAVFLAVIVAASTSRASATTTTMVKDGVRVSVTGKLTPTTLPRHGTAPIGVRLGGKIGLAGAGTLPKLTKLTIALNRHSRLDTRGLPRCRIGDIRPSTTREALARCGAALVGEGSFSANVKLPEQSPFPSDGKVIAFNGRYRGRSAILAHIYGTTPLPISYVLPFRIGHASGAYGTVLEAEFPEVTGEWGYVTGLSMNLHRRFQRRGHRGSYLSAGCPVAAGFTAATFPLALATFEFDSGLTISPPLSGICHVRR